MDKNSVKIASSPHIHHPVSTSKVMWIVSLTLLPAGAWGVYIYGIRALTLLLVSIFSALFFEYLLEKARGRTTLSDGSAFLTGLLIGYNISPSTPYYIPVAASFFAIFVVKWSFGGLGGNWMNPALAGRVFVVFSWPAHMAHWKEPFAAGRFSSLGVIDAVSAATPLGEAKSLIKEGVSLTSHSLTEAVGMWSYGDLFLGRVPGTIGEGSALLLIIGAAVLLFLRVANFEIVLSYLGSFALLVWVFGGLSLSGTLFSGDVLFHILAGGVMLGALFMATDMVSSPMTVPGMVIFGAGCGLITFLIRFYGSLPEGVSLAIIFMNLSVPLFDRVIKVKRFGIVEGKKWIK